MSVSLAARAQQDDPLALWAAGRLGRRGRGGPEVVFAQVREDAAVEVAAFAACERSEVAFCISSGGCTLFALLAADPRRLIGLDVNPAQVALLELKRAAYAQLDYPELLRAMTGDARPFYATLRPLLDPPARAFWDRRSSGLRTGLNGCGLAERRLAAAMRVFRLLVHDRRTTLALLDQPNLVAQRRFYRAHWDTWRWRLAFRLGLSRPLLRLAYGAGFLRQLPLDAGASIGRGVEAAFLETPVRQNPYLWQTFLGRYPPNPVGLPLALRANQFAAIRAGLGGLVLEADGAAAWLERQPADSIDFFALSNILEVTSPEYAARLWRAVARTGRAGGLACARSIFPPPPALQPADSRLVEERELSARLGQLDRSPVCRQVRVFRVVK